MMLSLSAEPFIAFRAVITAENTPWTPNHQFCVKASFPLGWAAPFVHS